MDNILIKNPYFLFLLLIIPILLIPLKYALLDFSHIHRFFIFFLRSILIILLTLTLSDPAIRYHSIQNIYSIFLVDVSRSITDGSLNKVSDYISKSINYMSEHDGSRVLLFDSEIADKDEITITPNPKSQIPRISDGLITDIESSVLKSLVMFPHGDGGISNPLEKRLILVTDGNETRGNALQSIMKVSEFGVSIYTLPIENSDIKGEVMITSFKVDGNVLAREKFKIFSKILATKTAEVECRLKLGTEKERIQKINLTKQQEFVFEWTDLMIFEKGIVDVFLNCQVVQGEDYFKENNSIHARIQAMDKPHILYIDEEESQRQHLISALSSDFRVEEGGCSLIPKDISRMKEYDLIFIGDCPRISTSSVINFSNEQMKLFTDYAKDGGGLIFTGGPHALGPGGYGGTYLEKNVLPVNLSVLEEKNIPKVALVLVIDRSGSMSGQKIAITKESAKATVSVLDKDDKIGVIAFDVSPKTIVAMENASNRYGIMKAISRIISGGGTNILPALKSAARLLKPITADIKHVILLTDGISPKEGVVETAEDMRQSRITVSTVAVSNSADKKLLSAIAEVGGGKYYYTDNPTTIPRIFLKETERLKKRGIIEEKVNIMVSKKFSSSQIFRGIDLKNAPPLLGFVSVKPKKKAEIILATETNEPILVRSRSGLGRVVIFASDVKSRWAHLWLRWNGFPRFIRQLVWDSLYTIKEHEWDMKAEIDRGILKIQAEGVADDGSFIDSAIAKTIITFPDSTTHEIYLKNTAPGIYEGETKVDLYGSYNISSTFEKNSEIIARSYTETLFPYPEELSKFATNAELLKNIADKTHGKYSPQPEEIFQPSGKFIEVHKPLRTYLLLASLIVFLLDLFLRRIRIGKPKPLKWP